MKKWYLLFVMLLLAACTPGSADLSAADETAIYASVIRQVVTVDDTFGGTLNPPLVYIVRQTDDMVGDPETAQRPSRTLPTDMQEAITAALSDLPATIVWVDSRDDVSFDPETGAVAGDGVIVTVGNAQMQSDGSVLVSASIYIAGLAAGGQTYILEQSGGQWTITGTTGVRWIS